MPIHFDVIRDGGLYSSRADGGTKFPVAQRVTYHENIGLANDNSAYGRQFNYLAGNFSAAFPFWAEFIEPTAICEGQSFITLNTYDRAKFTFGFAQFAAHVPDGDFVTWMRAMLALPEASDYFPELAVQQGRIVKLGVGGATPLETAGTTQPLMDYFNPSLSAVEDDEVIGAAKFIHWTVNHSGCQALQVKQMVATGHSILRYADQRLGLDGVTGDLCCIVMDIRHQGRGTFADMLAAMRASDPYNALINIGIQTQPERVRNLKRLLAPRRAAFAAKKWKRSQGEFV